MRIDPVYVIAPVSRPPSMSTRRAFLMAGAFFTVGSTLGGACGYSLGMQHGKSEAVDAMTSKGEAQDAAEEPLLPSGDADLDELRRLAVKAPIDELMGKRRVFVDLLHDSYPDDAVLWRGIERLCDGLGSEPPSSDRQLFAIWLAQIIEKGNPQHAKRLQARAIELRRLK